MGWNLVCDGPAGGAPASAAGSKPGGVGLSVRVGAAVELVAGRQGPPRKLLLAAQGA